MSQFQSLREYELFIYTLAQGFPTIRYSTLVVARRGRYLAELKGELAFSDEHRLAVYERLTWDSGSLTIEGYSYEVWRGNEKLYCTTPSLTPMTPRWPAPILTINTYRPILNTIVFLRQT